MNVSPINNNNINHPNFKGSVVKNKVLDEIVFSMKRMVPSIFSNNYEIAREQVTILNHMLNKTPKEDVFEFYATTVEKGYPDVYLLHNGKKISSCYARLGMFNEAGGYILKKFGKENNISIEPTEAQKKLKEVSKIVDDMDTEIAWSESASYSKKIKEKMRDIEEQKKVLQEQVDKELIADIEQVSKQLGY